MKRILLLAVVTCLFAGLPPAASAHQLPWKTLNAVVTKKLQRDSSQVANTRDTRNSVHWRGQRVKATPHFGQYWMQIYGYVYGTYCYYACGLTSQYYFTCVSWVNFRYANHRSRRYSTTAIPGQCYSFWIDNLEVVP